MKNAPRQQEVDLGRKLAAELLGTAFLLAIVVGSGIMGETLSGGNTAIALLANSIATGAGLIAIILTFGAISDAHFNPIVTLVESLSGKLEKKEGSLYLCAQFLGAILGVLIAHLMFGQDFFTYSSHVRSGASQLFSECIATFGLVAVIRGVGRNNKADIPYAIGAYITAAYWFTASTSFANPAVTLARAFTPTFAGIRPTDVVGFWFAQVLGALSAEYLFRWLHRKS